jgi:predicted MFS family arabinose efflux permease
LRRFPWSEWSRPFLFVVLCALFYQFGLGMQRTLFSNYASEVFGIGAVQLGWLESVREIPGLLTFLMIGLTVYFARNILIAFAVGLVGIGLLLYAGAGGMGGLVLATLTYGIGFHLFFPLQSAQVLGITEPGQKARRLGELSSVAALSYLLAMGLVYVFAGRLSYKQLFAIAAIVTMGGAMFMLVLPRTIAAERPRGFVVKRRYGLYYAITFLAASRRQIVTSFAVYALVREYGVPVKTIAALLFVSNVVVIFTRPLCGRITDRIGEMTALRLAYAPVIAVFLGYAFVRYPPALYVLYVVDNLFYGFDVAQQTYLDKIAVRGDVAPTLALGATINHITGVTVPVLSGFLWDTFGHWATFTFGAVVAACSLWVVGTMRLPAAVDRRAAPVVAGGSGV